MTSTRRLLAVAAAACVVTAGCRFFESSDGQVAAALRAEVERAAASTGGEAVVDVARAAPFEWDRLYVFPAYASAADAERELGFPWPTIEHTASSSQDQYALLVFVKGTKVVKWADFDLVHGDPLDGMKVNPGRVSGEVDRQHARFRVTVRPDGRRALTLINR